MPIVRPARSCGFSTLFGALDMTAIAATGMSVATILTLPPWPLTLMTALAETPSPKSARPLAITCAVTPPPWPSENSTSIPYFLKVPISLAGHVGGPKMGVGERAGEDRVQPCPARVQGENEAMLQAPTSRQAPSTNLRRSLVPFPYSSQPAVSAPAATRSSRHAPYFCGDHKTLTPVFNSVNKLLAREQTQKQNLLMSGRWSA